MNIVNNKETKTNEDVSSQTNFVVSLVICANKTNDAGYFLFFLCTMIFVERKQIKRT